MSEAKTLAEALVAAQAAMPAVERDAQNPHYRSSYVSLGNLLSTVRPILNEHGLAITQKPCLDEQGRFVLRTTLVHTSGESDTFDAPLNPTKNDPQGQGSAITYLRRYTIGALLGIADQEDDDGNAASTNGSTPTEDRPATEPQRKLLHKLLTEGGMSDNEQIAVVKARSAGDVLAASEASVLLDALMKDKQATVEALRTEVAA